MLSVCDRIAGMSPAFPDYLGLPVQQIPRWYGGSRILFRRGQVTAKDIVSQCFTKLWEKRDSVIAGGVVNYLFTMVRNACLDYRKLGRNKEVSERLLDKEGDVMKYYTTTIENTDLSDLFSDEILEICRRTIATLPPEQHSPLQTQHPSPADNPPATSVQS